MVIKAEFDLFSQLIIRTNYEFYFLSIFIFFLPYAASSCSSSPARTFSFSMEGSVGALYYVVSISWSIIRFTAKSKSKSKSINDKTIHWESWVHFSKKSESQKMCFTHSLHHVMFVQHSTQHSLSLWAVKGCVGQKLKDVWKTDERKLY